MERNPPSRSAGFRKPRRGARIEAERSQPVTGSGDQVLVTDLQRIEVLLLGTLQHWRIQREQELALLDRLAHRTHGKAFNPAFGPRTHLLHPALVEADVTDHFATTRQAATDGRLGAHTEVVHHGRRNPDLRAPALFAAENTGR